MNADRIKTTRETGDHRRTKDAGDEETRPHHHDDEITEQASHDGGITERTKVGGAERSAIGHRFVAAGGAAPSGIGTSEKDARPRFYLVACV